MSSRFEIRPAPLPGLRLLARQPVRDARGFLQRLFCRDELAAVLEGREVAQINHTCTNARGAVRGLHFQFPPHAEMKLVACLRGAVFDVAVDIRKSSPTFLRWHAQVLSPTNDLTMVIPEGFAHGFQALQSHSELLYVHTSTYQPGAEGGLNPRDPGLGIDWPLDVTDVSARDGLHPFVGAGFEGVTT